MAVLLLGGIAAACVAIFAAGYLCGHAAGRIYGRSEGWDEAVDSERAYLEALGVASTTAASAKFAPPRTPRRVR